MGQGQHATTNLYPALGYAGIELVATCANHNADYSYWLEMLDKEKFDAIIACVNPTLHFVIATEAAHRNIPIFIEKPPAPNAEDAKNLWILAKSFIMVGFNKRFAPVFQEAKRLIPKPVSISANINVGKCKTKMELGMEVGIHYVDLFRYFGKGGILSISDQLSWENATEHIEILGEGQLAIIDNGKLTHYKEGKITVIEPNRLVPDKENHLIFTNGYVGELSYFAEMVSQKKIGTSNIEDGFNAMLEIEKLYE